MNIKQAKQEIINTVQAYLTKDETGGVCDSCGTAASGTFDRSRLESVRPQLWNRWRRSVGSIWFLIRSRTIRDRVRSDCRLSRRKPMMGRMYRSQSIQ